MNAQLTVFHSDRPARRLPLDGSRHHVMGRDPACDIRINDDRVSGRHAELFMQGGEWYCQDLGSKNGTRVEGQVDARVRLGRTSWIDIGGVLVEFRQLDEAGQASEARRRAVQTETSLRVSQRLDPSHQLSRLLDDILAAIVELADTQRAFLMLENNDGDFQVVASHGLDQVDIESHEFRGSLGIVRCAIEHQASMVSCDVGGISRFADRPSIVTGGIRAVACLPIAVTENRRGVIYTDSKVPGKYFDELDLELLEGFAERSAVALGARLLRESLDSVAGLMHSRREGGRHAGVSPASHITLEGLLRLQRNSEEGQNVSRSGNE